MKNSPEPSLSIGYLLGKDGRCAVFDSLEEELREELSSLTTERDELRENVVHLEKEVCPLLS